jgi:hypothetical protein
MQFHHSVAAATLLLALAGTLAHAQSQAFTYQGELRSGNNLAQGPHDLRFEILDEGERVLQVLCADDVPVVDGRFTVLLDPGEEFAGLLRDARTIRVLVRPDTGLACDNDADFVPLSPTQPFTRSPLATRAAVADRADSASSLAGFTPSYFTNAANLTGTVPDAALSTNVPRLGASNSFTDGSFAGSTNTFDNLEVRGWLGSATGSVQLRANGQRAILIQQDFGAPRITMGSPLNSILSGAAGANILGGEGNRVNATFGTIAGGSNNILGTLGPGIIGSQYSAIGGGRNNEIQAAHAAIAGGLLNRSLAEFATVGGGELNQVVDSWGTISGGRDNRAGDGLGTSTDRPNATVGGGLNNRAEHEASTVAGGRDNRASAQYASIGGGHDNAASGDGYATIAGGLANIASGLTSTIAGGEFNNALGEYAAVGGGSGNSATTQFSTVGGGINNTAGGSGFSTVAGGSENDATGFVATVAGGDFNNASGERSSIGGGNGNATSARFSTVPGGLANTASGEAAAVGGGASNLAAAAYATVPGGANNEASGFTSLAAGWGARAVHDGAMVFADASQSGSPLLSTGPNQLTMRASGGTRLLGTGNAPRLTIDTAGTVTVPGTLNAGSIGFTTPRTAYKSYPAGAFVGGTYADDVPRRNGAALERITGASNSQMTLHVPIDLPHGAQITEILVYCKDTDFSRKLRFWLTSTAIPSQVATIVRDVTTAGLLGQALTINVTPQQPFTVDNSAGALEFVVLAEADNGAGSLFDNWGGGLEIIGLRVTYTVTSATP